MPDEQSIKPVEKYSRMPAGDVITRGLAVADKMDDNRNFPTLRSGQQISGLP